MRCIRLTTVLFVHVHVYCTVYPAGPYKCTLCHFFLLVPATESEFFQKSILSPWKYGATPIQALLASVSPFYDIRSMCLYVYNLPTSYTAQHLLKLFQLRYPSAFKAEIVKRERDGEDDGAGSSGDEDGETDGWSSTEDDGEDGGDEEGERDESRPRSSRAEGGSLLSGLRAGN